MCVCAFGMLQPPHMAVRAIFGLSNAASCIAHVKPRTLASSLFAWAFTLMLLLLFFAYLGMLVLSRYALALVSWCRRSMHLVC